MESILDILRGGQRALTIISISRMLGQGKTMLAKRIFDDPKVRENKDHDNWEIQDLTNKLQKSLKGIRYFLVLDDIWDVDTWRKVQESFPDDRNGSRILFTSRNCDLSSQSRLNSISYPLHLFSDEESLELIKDKISCNDDLPPELLKVGKQIAKAAEDNSLHVVDCGAIPREHNHHHHRWLCIRDIGPDFTRYPIEFH
ncbi:OLC1v1005744C1 [Oldenlandia corymbosa var. corymbosa]|uniref:OLC1v1005744C1 n=1 Tax=Oldenlandia corymbosa var. corymbosa TaxID=529605 RepID=A0AAV1DIR2_OLDCO|nr:OLC1v1005744C1 [Oldenlandia corymbosa var. corymbosa]